MQRPTKFEILGLFGNRDVTLSIDSDALILVGPNGIGKSSVTNIFYFFVSRQWSRLAEYNFSEVAIWFDKEEIRVAHADITGLLQIEKMINNFPPNSRTAALIGKLRELGFLEEFISISTNKSARYLDKIATFISIPAIEVRHLKMTLMRQLSSFESDEIYFAPRKDVENKLTKKLPGRSLYLPTYRRIEKDLKEIFPDLEDRIRPSARPIEPFKVARSAEHYIDLISFGMEDVRSNMESKSRFLRDYSLTKFNDLSGHYLKDVIKGTADQYSPSQIEDLDEDGLAVILSRVSEKVLSEEDKNLLREKILGMKGKDQSQMELKELYLAHYFTRLMSASVDITSQEKEVTKFVEVCNAYLLPRKQMVYDDTKFTIKIIDDRSRPIDLSMLSSGEKQVVSLFSHLYLDDYKDQIVIIDEPELSLSVPWQKRFLTDILDSNHCRFIFAVTHSPFIYDNKLKSSAVDLKLHTVFADKKN